MGVHRDTIFRNLKRHRETGGYKDRPRSGRPKATTGREDCQMRILALRNRFTNVPKIQADINNARPAGHQPVSSSTVRRRLHTAGLRGRKPAKRPQLKQQHKDARQAWAQTHLRWPIHQWQNVMFTDESRFCLKHSDGRVHVWRRPDERFASCCIQETLQGGGGSVMVWGGISLNRKSPLVFIEGNLNSERYIDEVLEPVVVPIANAVGDHFIIMDDNARPH